MTLVMSEIEVPCKVCGKQFSVDDEAIGLFSVDTWACDDCIKDYDERERKKKSRPVIPREQRWREQICPPKYLDTRFNHPDFPATLYHNEIAPYSYSWKGLLFTGPTGKGKTRSMLKILQKLYIGEYLDMEIKYPETFEWEIVNACAKGGGSATELMNRLSDVPVLAIDDFLAAKITERVRGFLFGLFDARVRNGKPTFFTTQLTGKEVINKLSGSTPDSRKTAQAFLRRLGENCKIVKF